ncbi:hypothetical protein SteCoe_26181 [Stentor coeruleus]|uniref:Uncharacterized protein n=1 Tax=Stentor coeruleus TaxID=5963 RepID=A0A1R2BDI5_9CILI|nr:hypothetical protein SteCoe_26181 [Stentor coeruleus]
MKNAELLKVQVYAGLEEIANFRLTQDSEINLGNYVEKSSSTTICGSFDLNICPLKTNNSYLAKAQSQFLASLHTAIELTRLKLSLKEILSKQD